MRPAQTDMSIRAQQIERRRGNADATQFSTVVWIERNRVSADEFAIARQRGHRRRAEHEQVEVPVIESLKQVLWRPIRPHPQVKPWEALAGLGGVAWQFAERLR